MRYPSALLVACLALLPAAPARTEAEIAPLPPALPWDGKSRSLIVDPSHPWITPSEASGLTRTPRYAETVDWLSRLVEAAPRLSMLSVGRSAEGRDIWMVVASEDGADTPAAVRASGRPTLLVQAGIHSGEIDGKDAGLMLLRDMTVAGTRSDLLEDANFLFIPILNVDGHERFSRFSRINQRGPLEMGWRTNRRNLNLNRDYAKLETEELRALARVVREWQPDLYVDVHVTDGADYQYDVTYGYNGRHAWSPAIAAWLDDRFKPAIDERLEAMGHVPGPLIFAANGRDMSGGYVDWTARPRFSNGWGDARHLATVLVENHSLKPYAQRVLGTYVFLESALHVLAAEHAALRAASATDRQSSSERVALGWQVDPEHPAESVPFEGVRSELYHSSVTGTLAVRWTGEPVSESILRLTMTRATTTVRRPKHYYIPAAWYPVVEILELQGIEAVRMSSATTLEVEVYRLPGARADTSQSPFEGRTLYLPGEVRLERREIRLPVGSFRIDTERPLGTLATLLLEPECSDSLFQWGYFAEMLQRTEYFEGYVMEPLARQMLEDDPQLRAEFESKLLADREFAGDPDVRLRWFYEKTPFYDAEYRVYPVARSVD